MLSIKEFAEQLKKEQSFAVFCHVRPDGDTVGSAVALKLALTKLGKKAEVFCDDTIPEKFFFLSEVKSIKANFEGDFSAYVFVDSADPNRVGRFSEFVSGNKPTFNIDHHISNTRYAKYNCVIDSGANAENIFDLINELGVLIDTDIANLLLLGTVTDTGGFKQKNATKDTLKKASCLVEAGADLNRICYETFVRQTKNRALLFAKVMNGVRYFDNDKIGVATVYQKDIKEFNANASDTEGFVDFVLSIDSIEVAVCLMELDDGRFKASLRSKTVNVNEVASLFGGGGHVLASGCQFNNEYEEVVDKLVYAIKTRIPE